MYYFKPFNKYFVALIMVLTLLFFPLISSLSILFFGRFFGQKGSCVIASVFIFLSFILSCFLAYEVFFLNGLSLLFIAKNFSIGFISADWSVLVDSLAGLLCVVVTFVSFLVHVYSVNYMAADPHLPRFMAYLSLFTFFMLVLVVSANLLQFFLGWEGVGLCSFLLISFWFTRTQANTSAIKAFIINRVGDFFFLLGLFALANLIATFSFAEFFLMSPFFFNYSIELLWFSVDFFSFVAFALFVGAMSKSAQLFLHTWLPDAMEGPTPVSALIHAATMVAAGVFLLARCSVFFVLSTNISMLVVLIGASTAFFAAVVGLFQQDIKKVVAYSTCSQLGYMVVAAGLTTFSFSIFHLVNHAFFKALLFLTSGAIIHSVGDHQDIRRMGGFSALLPFSYVMFLIGSLAICGVPFFSGFYSKDLIIESASVLETQSDYFNGIVYLLMFAAFFTAAYSFRLIYLVFFIDTKVIKILASTIHESSLLIVFPLAILGMCSLFFGFITFDCFSTAPSIVFKNTLFSNYSIFSLDLEYQEYFVKALPLIFTITGYFAAIVLTILNFQMLRFQMLRLFVVFHTKKWMVDINYNFFVAYNTFILSYKIFLLRMEKGLFEFIGPIFVVNLITKIAYKLSIVQSGFIYHYLAYFIFGFVSLVVLFASSILVGFFSSKLIFILIMSLLVSFFLIGSESFDFKQEFKLIFFSKTLQKIIFMFIVWVYPFAFATYSYILAACYLVYVHKYGTMPLVNWFISF